jgi:hypothetical protein
MLFKDISKNYNLNEGNFISKDITGIFDSDADFRLSTLKIDKLFEGLDIDNSNEIHNLMISSMPSLKDVLGKNKSDDTSAFELIRGQILYMEQRIREFDNELSEAFNNVIKATKYAKNPEMAKEKIAKISNPEGIGSIIPRVDTTVMNAKKTGYKFDDPALRTAFDSLYNLNVFDVIQKVLNSLEESAKNVGIKGIYAKIDSYDLKTIEAEDANLSPKLLTTNKKLDTAGLIKSYDVYDRLAGFYEEVLALYPFGRNMKSNYGENFEVIFKGPLGVRSLKQFVPNIDFAVFEPIESLLDEISSILINRVYADSPQETVKNIFTPSLQMMYVGLISLLAMKLINYNISAEKQMIAKGEEVKKEIFDSKKARVIGMRENLNNLNKLNFFVSSLVYRVGARGMDPNCIKEINNFLVNLGALPQTSKDSTSFDEKTEMAIKRMQKNSNAKKVDGAVGPETKAIMNIVAKHYINKYQIA